MAASPPRPRAPDTRVRTTSGTCPECGQDFTKRRNNGSDGRGGRPIYCSRYCANQANRLPPWTKRMRVWEKERRITVWSCLGCPRRLLVIGSPPQRRYCTRQCWGNDQSARIMGLYYTAAQHCEVGQAMAWRHRLIDALRDRDGDGCGICGTAMRFGVPTGPRGTDDEGATIDHVHPRSKGGSDDFANLRLAHWSCNRNRGNRLDSDL